MRLFYLLLLSASALTASAQKMSVKGQLADSTNAPLPSATVLLLNAKDSSLANFGVSDAQGFFEIRNVSKGNYLFKVSFLGFRTITRSIEVSETNPLVDLGRINMEAISAELAAIEIEAERAPVTVKRDTIEFNAGSFKTKQNAMVEDLLKKLPGVEVGSDGTITAQGETVRSVTVDGKNFFGSDPKIATRNLPADAVNKVQVFDKKSDQAQFTGVDDGQRTKTINLELKEEKRNGMFGNITAGAGTDDRFMGRASLNRFAKGKQLSFLGMGNNTNEQGFSMDDYMNFTGGAQQMMGGGGMVRLEFNSDNQNGVPLNFGNRANGIMTNYAGGVNFNREFSPKTELNGSYFYNYLDHARDQSSVRTNFLPQGSFSFNSSSALLNTNENHRANVSLEQKIDSANSFKLTSTFTNNFTDSDVRSESENRFPDGSLQNSNNSRTLSSGTTTSLNASLLWRHRFQKKGRNMSINLQGILSQTDREGTLDAENYFARNDSTALIRQTNRQENESRSLGATITYTEPLGKRRYLEGSYAFRQNLNDVNREVYDVNAGEPEFNPQLSNQFNSDYQYHRAGLNFRIARSKYNFVVGSSMQQTYLKGELLTLNATIDRNFRNFLPVVRLNYDFSNSKHFRFDYETSVQEPSIQQLQPVVDNSDPLNIYEGNPNLRPAYVQTWRASFNTFDPATFFNFFSFIDVNYTTNAITNAQTIDERLVRVTRPVNVSSNLSASGNANVGFPIPHKLGRINVGANYRHQRTVAILNDAENNINQNTIGGNVRYSYNYKEVFDVMLSADHDYQLTNYDFNQPSQNFVNQTYNAEGNVSFLKNYQFSTSFEYLVYKSTSTDFRQAIPLLNMSISRYVLKNKAGEIKLSVNNALDRALGVTQTANINYLERQTINSLGRYIMLSFTYALNKQLNPMGMRRGGGMIRIMR